MTPIFSIYFAFQAILSNFRFFSKFQKKSIFGPAGPKMIHYKSISGPAGPEMVHYKSISARAGRKWPKLLILDCGSHFLNLTVTFGGFPVFLQFFSPGTSWKFPCPAGPEMIVLKTISARAGYIRMGFICQFDLFPI